MKTGKIAFLFNTRNNYQLFDEIFFKFSSVDFSNYYFFNVDLDSTSEQKELAKGILDRHDIINLDADPEDPHIYSAYWSVQKCNEYIDDNNLDVDWVMWFSHDCHLIGDDFLANLEAKLESNSRFINEVGVIGFCDYNQREVGKPLYGRGDLIGEIHSASKHQGWYDDLPQEYLNSEYFIVECPNDNGVLINKKLWQKYIVPDYNFVLFLWVPDLCAQFGLHGISSITIPSLEMADLYRMKPQFGVSRSITDDPLFHIDSYGERPWVNFWIEKYGFQAGFAAKDVVRPQFNSLKERYGGSVQEQIFNWKISDGPKTLDDLRF
tara:strand:+ start:2023 stop:2988 length:966 start_codon:yes stop_codon:yes gene_type:complete